MRIQAISTNNITFKGDVHVYSDFDGTYCPEKHSSMHNLSPKPEMVEYCTKMDKFFKDTKNNLHFHVTTGRTLGEYEAISWLLKMRGYKLPLPETVITKNGSDEYIKIASDQDFYEKNIFPYNYKCRNVDKENKIKELTNWNGSAIKNYFKQKAKQMYFRFLEAESENSVKDYGTKSLFFEENLKMNEWKKLPQDSFGFVQHENPIVDFVLGSRNDGNLKTRLTFPPDYGYCPVRNYIYDSYLNDIRNYLKNNNVAYIESWENADYKNNYRKSVVITPQILNKELDKLYDTKEAIDKAKQNNDFVIVAGDGSNDFTMLNPLEYITKEEWEKFAKNTNCPEFFYGDMNKKLKDLKYLYNGYVNDYINDLRQELTQNGFLKLIENIPMTAIIIKNENSALQKLIDTFEKTNKVVSVKKGCIDEGIKLAIQNYAKQNRNFKNTMSQDFRQIILNE